MVALAAALGSTLLVAGAALVPITVRLHGQSKRPSKFPLSANAYMEFEVRQCPSNAISPCQLPIGSTDLGASCLMGVNYLDGCELSLFNFRLCAYKCGRGTLLPREACTSDPCNLKFQGKRGWQAAGALDVKDQETLAELYASLIALITSADRGDKTSYQKLGGDQEREKLKRAIVTVVLDKMIPFTACETPAMDRNDFTYPVGASPSAAEGAEELMELNTLRIRLKVFEGAFFQIQNSGRNLPEYIPHPDQVAAAFIHEGVHYGQRIIVSPTSAMGTAQLALDEVMAYERAGISTFYKMRIIDTTVYRFRCGAEI